MAKFKDSKGREYELVVTVKTLQVCKAEKELDLAKLLYPGSHEIQRITDDPILMCELCYLVSQHRLPTEQRIPIQDFYDSLAGDALDEAMGALLDSIADFYPRPEQRAFLRDLKAKAIGVTAKVFKEARANLEKVDLTPTTTEATTTLTETNSDSVATTTGESQNSPSEPSSSATNSPASSDSAPVNSTR
jgi:hypothetical protein